MFTTCPACRSNLAVSAADLRVGQGYVRCGRCDKVFNALMTLSEDMEEDEQSGLAATGTTTMPVLDDPDDEIPAEELVDEAVESAGREASDAAQPDDHMVDVVDSQSTGTFETIVLEGEGFLQTEEHVDEGFIDAQLQELTRQMDGSAVEPAHPDQEIVLETKEEDTGEPFDADAAVGNRRRRLWPWWLAASTLALALAAMLLHHNRQTLVAKPWAQRAVQAIYGMFGVMVEPRWDVNAYDVRRLSGDVVADASNGIIIQASIHNRALVPQPPPVIRVRLQDRYGNEVSVINITPAQYLLSAAPTRMAADQRFDTTLRLQDPTGEAAGFVLDACLPAAGGKLACSSP